MVIIFQKKEPMDTTESMKSDTPQSSAKEPSPQKEQNDNNIAGMSCLINNFTHIHTLNHFEHKILSIKFITIAFEYVFD